MIEYIDNLINLDKDKLTYLLSNYTLEDAKYAKEIANKLNVYKNKVFARALIEFSNYCKNSCKYCGLNISNSKLKRYHMDKTEILSTIKKGIDFGFKSFVLQSGEDLSYSNYEICDIVKEIKHKYSDVAITLSIGEKTFDEYKNFKNAGVDRYLLRHETITKSHYEILHGSDMSYENRIRCLNDLKKLNFQVGAGFMVGAPYQTFANISDDLLFLKNFNPHMVGIGPFIPQSDTEFSKEKSGDNNLTLFLISLIRILLPKALIPSTTALSVNSGNGFVNGINAGANVIMFNITPDKYKCLYSIYDNKFNANDNVFENFMEIKNDLKKIGMDLIFSRGDYYDEKN